MKWFKRIGIGLLVLVAGLVLAANFFLGSIVKTAVNTAGSAALGVPVTLAGARFHLASGKVDLKGLVLGNPNGFKTDHAISVGEIAVDLDVTSLLGDTIHIRRIYVNAPDIEYEIGLGRSNIGTIMDTLSGGDKEEKKEPAPGEKPGKKVVIDDFLIENGYVRIAAKLTGGFAAPIPLPAIHLTDIGKGKGGASPAEVIGQIFKSIFDAVTGLVTRAGKLVGEGAEAVGDGVSKAADAIGDLFEGGKRK